MTLQILAIVLRESVVFSTGSSLWLVTNFVVASVNTRNIGVEWAKNKDILLAISLVTMDSSSFLSCENKIIILHFIVIISLIPEMNKKET